MDEYPTKMFKDFGINDTTVDGDLVENFYERNRPYVGTCTAISKQRSEFSVEEESDENKCVETYKTKRKNKINASCDQAETVKRKFDGRIIRRDICFR